MKESVVRIPALNREEIQPFIPVNYPFYRDEKLYYINVIYTNIHQFDANFFINTFSENIVNR